MPLSYLERIISYSSVGSIQIFAGASAGLASSIVTCPLDVVKTKLQGQDGLRLWSLDSISIRRPFQDRGLVGTGRAVWREEGLRGMYKGLGPTMLGYLPLWGIYFYVYHRSEELLDSKLDVESEWISAIISSIVAGVCSTIFTNPIKVIKTRIMSQTSVAKQNSTSFLWQYTSTLDAARKMYRNEGIASFYSGLTPGLLGVTHLAIQFPLYGQLKKSFTGAGLGRTREGEDMQITGILSASILSKVCATAATYPHEVIRTRLQTQRSTTPAPILENKVTVANKPQQSRDGGRPFAGRLSDISGPGRGVGLPSQGIIGTFTTTLRQEGWRAFYAGMGTSMIRAIPASATTMVVYEMVVQFLTQSKREYERKRKIRHNSK